ncbi:MAG: deoxyribodipyrimidine photo-lyase [Ilumatobacteraceae bacterium]
MPARPRAVLWFRRDLRLDDHPALAATHAHGDVVPLFVVDPAFAAAGLPRRGFMASALQALDERIGGALVYRHGDPVDVVPAFAAEVGADVVIVTRDHGPYGHRRDAAVAARLAVDGRKLRGVGSNFAVDPGTVHKADRSSYCVHPVFEGVARHRPKRAGPNGRRRRGRPRDVGGSSRRRTATAPGRGTTRDPAPRGHRGGPHAPVADVPRRRPRSVRRPAQPAGSPRHQPAVRVPALGVCCTRCS